MKSTSRRNFLQSVGGAMVALPWLESVANADAGASVAKRMVHYYVPIGVGAAGLLSRRGGSRDPQGESGAISFAL